MPSVLSRGDGVQEDNGGWRSVTPGDPTPSPRPSPPSSHLPTMFLLTLVLMCALFLMWKRARELRKGVGRMFGLKSLSTTDTEQPIRLSMDDGPNSLEFIHDDGYGYEDSLGGSGRSSFGGGDETLPPDALAESEELMNKRSIPSYAPSNSNQKASITLPENDLAKLAKDMPLGNGGHSRSGSISAGGHSRAGSIVDGGQ